MSLTSSLDFASYIYGVLDKKDKDSEQGKNLSASVIIPAHNEANHLYKVVKAQYSQTKAPKNVFVINDNSTDSTEEICQSLQREYPSLVYVHNQPAKGKARSIQAIVEEHYSDLGDVVYVNDGDLIPDKHCLEELLKGFDEPRVAAVTGLPRLISGGSLLSRTMTHGKEWQIQVLKWRKAGQVVRNGMFVLCGAEMAIKKDVLKKHPFPTRTKTEDLDYTWVLNEQGYKLNFQEKATCESYDVTDLKSHWNQTRRWHKGAWQAMYCHGKDLPKAKGLFYTTLVPFWAEAILYTGKMATLPFLYSYSPALLASLAAIELGVNVGITLASKPDYLKYLPASLLYQGMCFTSYLISGVETTIEKLKHQEDKWKNKWAKNVQVQQTNTSKKESFERDNFLFLTYNLENPSYRTLDHSYAAYNSVLLDQAQRASVKIKDPELKYQLNRAIKEFREKKPIQKLPEESMDYATALFWREQKLNPSGFDFYGEKISDKFYDKKVQDCYVHSKLPGSRAMLRRLIISGEIPYGGKDD